MKLFSICRDCKQEMMFKSDSNTRVEFAMNEGKTRKIRCKHCGAANNIHVNDIYATESKLALLIALLVFAVGTPLTFFLMINIMTVTVNHYVILMAGGILLVPVFIYIMISKQEQTRVSGFNRIKLT